MASRILIIEDDPHTIKLVGLYLGRDGHKVLEATDGVGLAREAAPDILLDLMLPRLDGIEICRALREDSDVPIVMVTARVEEEDRLAGLDLGADRHKALQSAGAGGPGSSGPPAKRPQRDRRRPVGNRV